MQYGPSIAPGSESLALIERGAALLEPHEVLVEFRQRDWLREERREETIAWLADRGLTYVVVDAPRVTSSNVAQTVVARTTGTAYVRFHGRNAGTWNVSGGAASERFDHYYAAAELEEWVDHLRELARGATGVYAFFNTNNADQGPVNAELLRSLLERGQVPVAPAPGPSQGSLF
jgi:uncharacterized protein YecE (DUF72 family)